MHSVSRRPARCRARQGEEGEEEGGREPPKKDPNDKEKDASAPDTAAAAKKDKKEKRRHHAHAATSRAPRPAWMDSGVPYLQRGTRDLMFYGKPKTTNDK